MENLFEVVQKIELKKYSLVMDKHDIQDVIVNSLNIVSTSCNDNQRNMFRAALSQILQKLAAKKFRFTKTGITTCKINLSAVEYYALRELIDQTPIDNMPTFHSILVQLDTQ